YKEGTWMMCVTNNFSVDNSCFWNGGCDCVSWIDASNCAPHSLPGAANDVIISVAGAPTILVNANVSIGNLQLGESLRLSAGAGAVLRLGSLTIEAGGSIDLNDNEMIVDYAGASPLSAVTAMLASGFNGGSWNGRGIRSSA